MVLSVVLVKQIVLKDYQNASRTFWSSRDRDEHMSRFINSSFLLPDHSVHSKIHLVIDNGLPDISGIDSGFLVLKLSIVHLNANKHSIIASSVQSNAVNADAV
jgi:hypothetical protein